MKNDPSLGLLTFVILAGLFVALAPIVHMPSLRFHHAHAASARS